MSKSESTPPSDVAPPKRRGSWLGVILAALLLAAAIGAAVWYNEHGVVGDDGLTNAQRKQVTEALDAAGDYIRHDKIPKARLILMKLLDLHPEHGEANHLMAQVLLAEDKTVEAYAHLSKSLAVDPDRAEPQFSAGVLAQKMNRLDAAFDHYTKAASLEPDSAKYPLYVGQLLLKSGKLKDAAVQLEKARSLNPAMPQVHGLLAQLAEQLGKNDEALTHINRALEQVDEGDESYDAYMLLKALALRKTGQATAALGVLHAMPSPKKAEQQVVLVEHFAACYLANEDYPQAAGAWASLFAAQPYNARAAAEAGLCYRQGNDVERARRCYNLAQRVDRLDETVKKLADALEKVAPRPAP